MRYATIILSILLLILSCIPCADQGLGGTDSHDHYSSVQERADNHHSHHSDACSPLCVCSCCSVVTFVHQHVSVDLSLPASLSAYNSFHSHSYPEQAFPIFQPPQLV
ncbi:DUF6660 family protein [Chitinophaga sp.]|uniref:DUF6660 family protein n=1 Tax=Chitinophaga sp. TaxID=1869181 RepID=UPI00260D03D7|nr:DUF6660 family protein [uncultured Chitinophaga sp.]